ncbi:MAG: PhnD/SsuA/transferrin family substrate-binding protein [Hyphomicrobium sp.]|jgi:phosphonate transport system substrate-binding protein
MSPGGNSTRLSGAFDANLDFPFADPAWASFSSSMHCSITSYTDLDILTTALRQQLFDFSYLPGANCFFLQNAPYRGIASALTAITRRPSQSSLLIVAKSNPATQWTQLRGKRLGYINTYCTTSYFAPSILLAQQGFALTKFFDAFPVAAWQGQIDAVIAGSIDATMVYEDVWLETPSNAEQTKVLAHLDDLPTPPVIVRNNVPAAVTDKLTSTLSGFEATRGPGALYSGFAAYEDSLMQRFFADMAALPGTAHAA